MPSETEQIERLEIRSKWGDVIVIEVPAPKPDVPQTPETYFRIEQRCAYYLCNRLHPITVRNNKIYCSELHGQAQRDQRKKEASDDNPENG